MSEQQQQQETLYPKIGDVVDDEEKMPTIVESLCMNCHEKGSTKLLFTEIPFFRQVILMSFRCEHCNYSNNEIRSASAIQEVGVNYKVQLTCLEDLQRQVVKSDHATFRIEELDFEIPPNKGVLTTIEGLLTNALEELESTQPQRRLVDMAVANQVDEFIGRLAACIDGSSLPFQASLDDPSGNSFLENLIAPKIDPKMQFKTYQRTDEQNQALGLQEETYEHDNLEARAAAEAEQEEKRAQVAKSFAVKQGAIIDRDKDDGSDERLMEKEVFQIPTNCPNCGTPGTSKTCLTDIPFFQQVIIMAFDCEKEDCGYKTNEIKGGGPIPEMGKITRLIVPSKETSGEEIWSDDMQRDVVKSNSAGILLPEIEVEVTAGSLGGIYTTVEGLLNLIKDSLFEGQAADFIKGDSANDETKARYKALEEKFVAILDGRMAFTLEIRDPLAASYVYSPVAPDPEPRLTYETYERTHEENEELGLNDMNTENYDTLSPPESQSLVSGDDDDTHLDNGRFEGPFESFQGARTGMVFRLGLKGLGYYQDSNSMQDLMQNRMRQVQVDGRETHPNPSAVSDF